MFFTFEPAPEHPLLTNIIKIESRGFNTEIWISWPFI